MIVKAALLLFRENTGGEKELLFARAYNRPFYIFPGGKQEEGEAIEDALSRELQEELQVGVKDIEKLGVVEGNTPDGRALQMHLFTAGLIGDPKPSAEIESIEWMTQSTALKKPELMTPMTLEHVFPFLAEKKLW